MRRHRENTTSATGSPLAQGWSPPSYAAMPHIYGYHAPPTLGYNGVLSNCGPLSPTFSSMLSSRYPHLRCDTTPTMSERFSRAVTSPPRMPDPVVFNAGFTFRINEERPTVYNHVKVDPASSVPHTASFSLTRKIDRFLKKSDHSLDRFQNIIQEKKLNLGTALTAVPLIKNPPPGKSIRLCLSEDKETLRGRTSTDSLSLVSLSPQTVPSLSVVTSSPPSSVSFAHTAERHRRILAKVVANGRIKKHSRQDDLSSSSCSSSSDEFESDSFVQRTSSGLYERSDDTSAEISKLEDLSSGSDDEYFDVHPLPGYFCISDRTPNEGHDLQKEEQKGHTHVEGGITPIKHSLIIGPSWKRSPVHSQSLPAVNRIPSVKKMGNTVPMAQVPENNAIQEMQPLKTHKKYPAPPPPVSREPSFISVNSLSPRNSIYGFQDVKQGISLSVSGISINTLGSTTPLKKPRRSPSLKKYPAPQPPTQQHGETITFKTNSLPRDFSRRNICGDIKTTNKTISKNTISEINNEGKNCAKSPLSNGSTMLPLKLQPDELSISNINTLPASQTTNNCQFLNRIVSDENSLTTHSSLLADKLSVESNNFIKTECERLDENLGTIQKETIISEVQRNISEPTKSQCKDNLVISPSVSKGLVCEENKVQKSSCAIDPGSLKLELSKQNNIVEYKETERNIYINSNSDPYSDNGSNITNSNESKQINLISLEIEKALTSDSLVLTSGLPSNNDDKVVEISEQTASINYNLEQINRDDNKNVEMVSVATKTDSSKDAPVYNGANKIENQNVNTEDGAKLTSKRKSLVIKENLDVSLFNSNSRQGSVSKDSICSRGSRETSVSSTSSENLDSSLHRNSSDRFAIKKSKSGKLAALASRFESEDQSLSSDLGTASLKPNMNKGSSKLARTKISGLANIFGGDAKNGGKEANKLQSPYSKPFSPESSLSERSKKSIGGIDVSKFGEVATNIKDFRTLKKLKDDDISTKSKLDEKPKLLIENKTKFIVVDKSKYKVEEKTKLKEDVDSKLKVEKDKTALKDEDRSKQTNKEYPKIKSQELSKDECSLEKTANLDVNNEPTASNKTDKECNKSIEINSEAISATKKRKKRPKDSSTGKKENEFPASTTVSVPSKEIEINSSAEFKEVLQKLDEVVVKNIQSPVISDKCDVKYKEESTSDKSVIVDLPNIKSLDETESSLNKLDINTAGAKPTESPALIGENHVSVELVLNNAVTENFSLKEPQENFTLNISVKDILPNTDMSEPNITAISKDGISNELPLTKSSTASLNEPMLPLDKRYAQDKKIAITVLNANNEIKSESGKEVLTKVVHSKVMDSTEPSLETSGTTIQSKVLLNEINKSNEVNEINVDSSTVNLSKVIDKLVSSNVIHDILQSEFCKTNKENHEPSLLGISSKASSKEESFRVEKLADALSQSVLQDVSLQMNELCPPGRSSIPYIDSSPMADVSLFVHVESTAVIGNSETEPAVVIPAFSVVISEPSISIPKYTVAIMEDVVAMTKSSVDICESAVSNLESVGAITESSVALSESSLEIPKCTVAILESLVADAESPTTFAETVISDSNSNYTHVLEKSAVNFLEQKDSVDSNLSSQNSPLALTCVTNSNSQSVIISGMSPLSSVLDKDSSCHISMEPSIIASHDLPITTQSESVNSSLTSDLLLRTKFIPPLNLENKFLLPSPICSIPNSIPDKVKANSTVNEFEDSCLKEDAGSPVSSVGLFQGMVNTLKTSFSKVMLSTPPQPVGVLVEENCISTAEKALPGPGKVKEIVTLESAVIGNNSYISPISSSPDYHSASSSTHTVNSIDMDVVKNDTLIDNKNVVGIATGARSKRPSKVIIPEEVLNVSEILREAEERLTKALAKDPLVYRFPLGKVDDVYVDAFDPSQFDILMPLPSAEDRLILDRHSRSCTPYNEGIDRRSPTPNRIVEQTEALLSETDRILRKTRSHNSLRRSFTRSLSGMNLNRLTEVTADLTEEHSTSHLAGERIEAEQAERMRLEKEVNELQSEVKRMTDTNDKLEMERVALRTEMLHVELNGDIHDSDEAADAALYKRKYEWSLRELEVLKKQLKQQQEDDLDQLLILKKQLEKKICDSHEETEEQRQVATQLKKKSQRLQAEMNDMKILLEEQTSRNNLLEKKQRKFDQDVHVIQEELRNERLTKDKIQREKDQTLSEKYSFEQEVATLKLELELKDEKVAALTRELNDLNFTGKAEEEVAILKKAKHDLELRVKDQEEELDDLAGQVQMLESARLRLEMSIEQMRKENRKEAQLREEEMEEVRVSAQKKVKAFEAQLEAEHDERTQLMREKHELERRLAAVQERTFATVDEDAFHKVKKELKKTKALLKDTQTMLEKTQSEGSNKLLLRQLKTQLEDAEFAKTAAIKARQSAESESAEIQCQLEEVLRTKNDAEERCMRHIKEKTEMQTQLEEGEEEVAEVMKKYKAAVSQLSVDQINISEQAQMIAELEHEKQVLQERLTELSSKVEVLEGETANIHTQRRLQMKIKELESKLELESTTRQRLESQITRLKDQVERICGECDAAKGKEAQTQDYCKKLNRQLREAKENLTNIQQKHTDATNKKQEIEKQFELAESEIITLKSDLKLAFKRIEDLQQALQGDLSDSDTELTDSESESETSLTSYLTASATQDRPLSNSTARTATSDSPSESKIMELLVCSPTADLMSSIREDMEDDYKESFA